MEPHSWNSNGQSSRPAAMRSGLWVQPCPGGQDPWGLTLTPHIGRILRLRHSGGQSPKPYNQRKKQPDSSHWKEKKTSKDTKWKPQTQRVIHQTYKPLAHYHSTPVSTQPSSRISREFLCVCVCMCAHYWPHLPLTQVTGGVGVGQGRIQIVGYKVSSSLVLRFFQILRPQIQSPGSRSSPFFCCLFVSAISSSSFTINIEVV